MCSSLQQLYGWKAAFIAILISFMMGTSLFSRFSPTTISGRTFLTYSHYLKAALLLTVTAIIIFVLFNNIHFIHGLMGIIALAGIICFSGLLIYANPEERFSLLKTIPYILSFALFCSLFEQAASSLLIFFDRFVDRHIFNTIIPASTLLSINPILVLIIGMLLPVFAKISPSINKQLHGLTKVGLGYLSISLSFGILGFAALETTSFISLFLMILTLIFQTMGELLIVPIGFTAISELVPRRYISFMMGFWLMAIAFGHYLAGLYVKFLLLVEDMALLTK